MLQGHKNSGMCFWRCFFSIARYPHPFLYAARFGTQGSFPCPRFFDSLVNCRSRSQLLTIIIYAVISVAPSPMGGLFATGSGDMRARIWRLVPSAENFPCPSVIVVYHFTPPKWGHCVMTSTPIPTFLSFSLLFGRHPGAHFFSRQQMLIYSPASTATNRTWVNRRFGHSLGMVNYQHISGCGYWITVREAFGAAASLYSVFVFVCHLFLLPFLLCFLFEYSVPFFFCNSLVL